MTSSLSTQLDRKALKRPDALSTTLKGFFDALSKNTRALIAAAVLVLLVMTAFALFMSKKELRSDEAKGAFFLAEKAFQTEMKAMAESMQPAEKSDAKETKDAKEKKEPKITPESLAYRKFDVDAKLPETIKKYQSVAQEFSGTRSAYEARVALGGLYFDHGQPEKAIQWFEKSIETAPDAHEKAIALMSLGYAYENSGKSREAIDALEKALNLGEAGIKGDLLLAIARNHEQLKDTAKARSTYEQILSQLPNTEFSRAAEQFKAQLD